MSKVIYIASPYSHEDKTIEHERYETVAKITAKLTKEGVIAFSPITYGHTLLRYEDLPAEYEFWETFCLSFLKRSNEFHVYMMPGWDKSKGIANETKYAIENRIPVVYKDV